MLTGSCCMQAVSTPVAADLPGSTEALRGLPSWQWPRTAAPGSDPPRLPARESQAAAQADTPAAGQPGLQDAGCGPVTPAAASQAQVMSQLQAHVQLQSNAAACSAAIRQAGAEEAACLDAGSGAASTAQPEVASPVHMESGSSCESAGAAPAPGQAAGGTSGAPQEAALRDHPLDSSKPGPQPSKAAATVPALGPVAAAAASARGPSTGSMDAAHVFTAAAMTPGAAVKPAAKLSGQQVRAFRLQVSGCGVPSACKQPPPNLK